MNVSLQTFIWLTLTLVAVLTAGCGSLPVATPASAALVTTEPTAAVPPTPTPTAPPSPAPEPASTPTPAPTTGHDDVPMVEIPAGEFIMGLPLEEAETLRVRWLAEYDQPNTDIDFHRSSPRLTAYLDTFKIDKLEVTNARYQTCVVASVCREAAAFAPDRSDYPIYVPYAWAQDYCQWVGKRLPTEAEWEKAARGTDSRLFPWGDEWQADRVALEISPVGSHPKDVSPYGVLDMAGNIDEWTQSPLIAYPGHANPKLFNAELPVERGALGYKASLWAGALTTMRGYGADLAGFRCVAGGKPLSVAEVVVSYEPMVPPPPPAATVVDLSQMVEIPAGPFLRGVDEQNMETYMRAYLKYHFVNQNLTMADIEQNYVNARPQQSVYLDRYYIDRFPVTAAEFVAFLNGLDEVRWSCGGWRCVDRGADEIGYKNKKYVTDYESYPIPAATWDGARAYCMWRGKRLPTEAEWEKAARGTDGRLYPWGNEWDPRVREHKAPGGLSKDPIGSKPYLASPYGVEDLIGITTPGEWVADWYAEDYYGQADSTHNPQGPTAGEKKILRGNIATQDLGIPLRFSISPILEIYGGLSTGAFRCAYTTNP